MPERSSGAIWWLAMTLFRPDMEHLLCLILFSMISMLGFVLWTYEEGLTSQTDRLRKLDVAYQSVLDGFVREGQLLREQREAQLPEFPDDEEEEGDTPDVIKRHRESATKLPLEKVDRILRKINKNFKSKRKKKVARGPVSNPPDLLGNLQGGEVFCTVYDTKPNISEDFECIRLTWKPPVHVCLYPDAMDIHVSYNLRKAGVWEPHILRHFQNLLFQDPELGVYDIGTHVGQYSLVAAAMGRRVVAVEPFPQSIKRLHQAIKLDKLEDKIIVVQNAVSDRRDTLELSIPSDNHGGISLTSQDADRFCTEPDCVPHATTILMDDLLEVTNFEKAIMKIDIEGHEHRAFIHSRRLFQAIDIQYIIMEWIKLRGYYVFEAHNSPDKRLVFQLVDYLVEMGYTPKGSLLLNRLDPRFWYGWPDDIFWEAGDARKHTFLKNSTVLSNHGDNSTVGRKHTFLKNSAVLSNHGDNSTAGSEAGTRRTSAQTERTSEKQSKMKSSPGRRRKRRSTRNG